ncbi:hypothetical protein GLYMA_13G273200v4 [Glycine max]|uniref:Uncharacterized protein n=2 Tax=Glycine subgen. Soja TaxID=1462606 RepID=I1M343_SOYBN|nr:uncharacterized protein LOC100803315 [Glycine max]XP_028188517.1 uncharacterized protein LOC114374985 [Glycine soja]KAG4960764.1 hypothetical protein JHK87_037397 [Glycine soja]KAG4971771.1 hypothetical protein JHK85_038192 [Glycine max]KHN36857.1 hypothetical protein glysoja_001588 [Glycine soja]KRH22027.1 hypothetical protein GLYMA_13G273200v4 [Glycine max]RZB83158.1 hypothetical protein D0Y65_031950 [Glycine soja]|eukprot:XP_003541833.1 uncharacterized protein LOC100803315 [Glycine max]
MEPIGNSYESSFSKDEKVEAADLLLEECWFFDNLLKITPRMTRCHSEPYPSSTGLISPPDFLVKDSNSNSSSPSKPLNNGAIVHPKIQRAPYMPPLRLREEEEDQKGSSSTRSKLVHQPTDPVVSHAASKPHCAQMKGRHNSDCVRRKSKLLRTPSLPPSIGRDEKLQVYDTRPGRFHKQPSTPTQIDILPPRQTSKSCSIPRCRPARKTEVESFNKEGIMEMRRRYLNQKTMRRSLSDLEFEEVQGFKDLGFSFEKETLSPSLASILPGLQEKKRDETEEDKAARRPYLSEAWLVQSCAPAIPNWTSHKSSGDMKVQIKFWARAVASNVHLKC